ncbi:Activator of Hsp90 ATPase-like ue 1-like C-terminal domain-containing protein [Flavobacterium longum]|uniref:SRPBCC family protein n=1 Tax=Flavobacterium longum TaxID=1299340 RepID=UPI0039ED71ED
MKTNLLMNFSVDKESNKINVQREFAAAPDKVWTAWTDPKWLDQWWAPKPWQTVTVSMDFSEGGMWLYYMQGPEGERHYCRDDYKTIDPGKSFSAQDAFCDADGNINEEWPRMTWHNTFEGRGNSTMVHIVITFDKPEDLEKIIEMGFKEGFTMAMENLDGIFGGE